MALHQGEPGIPAACLDGRYDILPGTPAGEFRTPAAEPFRAIDRDRPADALFALICDPGLPPRQDLIEVLAPLHVDELMTPRASGVVDWAPLGRRCVALIFAEPGGARVTQAMSDTITPITEDEVLSVVLPSLLTALKALFALGLTHRAIRPTNLYRRASDRRIVLGECVSAPPAFAQPVIIEPIESALALPVARGEGTAADDLYALGVTLVHLLLGRDPSHGLTDDQVLVEKMNRGSFAMLLAGERPPLRILEILRGLLADDPRERWTLADLHGWIERRRLAVKQYVPPKRAARPLEVDGIGHVSTRSLAHAFARDPPAGAKLIRSGDFDIWLQRSLVDPERSAAVALAVDGANSSINEARFVARVTMALDPRAPIRYGSFAAAVDGLGPALAAAYHAGSNTAVIAEVISARLPQFWFTVQANFRPEQSLYLRTFDRHRQLLDDRRPGFGVERLLYELNPGLHCLSPTIERDCVTNPRDVLPALERASAGGRVGDLLVDRHIAAFLAVRCRHAVADWHDDLASTTPQQRISGVLHVLARLQSLFGPASVPSLGERLGREVPVLVDRYHSHSRRQRLRAAIAKPAAQGHLPGIVAVVASRAERRRDDAEYRAAHHEYAEIGRALATLRDDKEGRARETVELGGRLSVAGSIILAWSVAIASLLMVG